MTDRMGDHACDPFAARADERLSDAVAALRPVRGVPHRRAALVTPEMIGRLILMLAALAAGSILAFPSLARAEDARLPAQLSLRLRGDVVARGDVLTLGDLVENAPAGLAERPLFRAPALGAAGTIQVRRIVEALDRLDLGGVESGGRVQIQVQRAARRVGPPEIEAALRQALSAHGLDPEALRVRLDGEASLLAPLDLQGQARALDVSYDPRSHRVAALIVLGERQASLRVTAQVAETREVAVLTRALNRGEALAATDIAIERRPRETITGDALNGAAGGASQMALGQVAQRPLNAGAVLRSGDLAPPELVQRGEAVTIVFETPGVSLSLTGLANESGRLGASVPVLNPASKKTLQAVVIGPGRVSVGPGRAAPMMQASAALRSAN